MSTPEEAIRRTMGRYIQAHDTRNVDEIVNVFAEDGAFINSRGEWRGRPAIREFFEHSRTTAAPGSRMKLMCANSIITVEGERAAAVTDVMIFRAEGDGPWHVPQAAQYADTFVLTAGEWLYAEKNVTALPTEVPAAKASP
ncbi:MAG TPA: nuclear transport factor 2 family protein [Chloroflexota bacterium]|nr:nuclear transport factor 2 family protein [Chloroflexota bacterium]